MLAAARISATFLHFLSKVHPFYITPSFCTHREKIDLADSEKRTPEVKFQPFCITIPKNPVLPKSINFLGTGASGGDESILST